MDILVPIAKSNKTGKTVFIDDVPSGMGCDCRCIGCDVSLVARKGEIKIHHFAHVPKKVNKKHHCPFSFERSVFWMIREVLISAQKSKQPKKINLPCYTISYQDKLISSIYQKRVTNRHQVSFEQVEFPKALDKTRHTDLAILTVAGYRLAITYSLKNMFSHSPYFWQKSRAYFINGQSIAHLQVDLSGLQNNISKPMGYAEQKQIKETMLNNIHSRLQELLEQAEAFRKQGNNTGNRCQCCYFMNLPDQDNCQYCQSDSLLKVELNDGYFENIERKYDCGCFAIFSVKALTNFVK